MWAARGGYGVMRILRRLDPALLRKPILGFSDLTALHAFAAAHDVFSIHAPVVTQLAELGQDDLTAAFAVAEGLPQTWGSLVTHGGSGMIEGVTAGGNLEVLSRLCGTPWQWSLDGKILFLEEIGERPYRIDRSLTQLELAGAFKGLRAVVVGDLINCEEKKQESPTAEAVIVAHFAALNVPVVTNAPFGHGVRNHAFPLGVPARLDLDRGELTF